MTLGLSYPESCGLLTFTNSVRLCRGRSDVTTNITRSNRVQSSSYTSSSPSKLDHISSQDSPCGNWPLCQLWWFKLREVWRVLYAIHYATLYMLVFRVTIIHPFVKYRLHRLPWAKDGTPHLFNYFITNSWLATLPLSLPCLTLHPLSAMRYCIHKKMSAKSIPDKNSAKHFAKLELQIFLTPRQCSLCTTAFLLSLQKCHRH